MINERTANYEDLTGVKSRLSWGAIVGGSAVAFAVYVVLTLFFTGLGLSLSEAGVRNGVVGIGGIVVGIISMVVALFVGGCVTTQLTAGETRRESMIYGVLTWATVTALSVAMVGVGVRAGYQALLGATYVAQSSANDTSGRSWEETARSAGIPQDKIDQLKQSTTTENVRKQAQDPQNQEAVRTGAVTAAWAAFLGTLFTMGAAIWGALVGSGPQMRVFHVAVRSDHSRVAMTP